MATPEKGKSRKEKKKKKNLSRLELTAAVGWNDLQSSIKVSNLAGELVCCSQRYLRSQFIGPRTSCRRS